MSPEAIRLMADKGLSAHDIAEIAEAMQTKSSGAERQARYRERKRAIIKEGDVTCDVTSDVTPQKEKNPLKETIQKPLKKEKPTSNEVLCIGDVQAAVEIWNGYANQSGAKQIRGLSDKRTSKLRLRLGEQGLEGWREAMGRAGLSEMLGSDPPQWFKFDFMIENETNILKLLEGNYDKHFTNHRNGGGDRNINAVAGAKARLAVPQGGGGTSERRSGMDRTGALRDVGLGLGHVPG